MVLNSLKNVFTNNRRTILLMRTIYGTNIRTLFVDCENLLTKTYSSFMLNESLFNLRMLHAKGECDIF